jgi:dGTPase
MRRVDHPEHLRERTEERERAHLSSWATLALETKGRDRYETDDPLRTVFQADRERIAGSRAWVALAGKSAVLPRRVGRTQMDEALTVVAVARDLARALRLNEDLTEAIALGQALGMTAHAAAGAEGLWMATGDPYRPEEQALRVVERLSGDGAGLNLTWETRDGILHHRWDGPVPATLEGAAVRLARRAVEVSARIDDAAALGVGVGDGLPAPAADLVRAGAAARLDGMLLGAARASVDRPELGFGDVLTAILDATHAACEAALQGTAAWLDAHARAVHVMASLAVVELEHGTGVRGVVDALTACTDAELLARYRAALEP